MHTRTTTFISSMLVTAVALLSACQTNQPGVKSSYRSQWATVSATTTETAEVAKDVLEDLRLKNIQSNATSVDGKVEGFTADDTRITVDIERVTDKTTQVSVNVGAMGDPDLGKEILARIQEETN